jgi:hypothetical protein
MDFFACPSSVERKQQRVLNKIFRVKESNYLTFDNNQFMMEWP